MQKKDIENISLDILEYRASKYINRDLLYGLEYNYIEDHNVEDMIYQLSLKLKKHQLEYKEVKYPKDWWQSLKERFAPEWFKKRYPVEYKEVRLTACEVLKNKVFNKDNSEIFIMKDSKVV